MLDEKYILKDLKDEGIENITTENSDVNETLNEFMERIKNLILCGKISINEAKSMFNQKYPGTFSE